MKHQTSALLLSLLTFSAPLAKGAEISDSIVRNLGEIVVTGTNSGVPEKLLPYTVSVIGNQELEATGQTQVLSAISGMVPSLFVTQRSIFGFGVSNGGSGHIKLRGVGGDRASGILMMVDGQPQYAGIYSHHIADFYGKEYVDHVEVLRGPGSVLYGSNAMAGAINIITKQAKHDGIRTSITSQYGSYNTWLSSITNTTRFGKFSSLVSLSYNRTDGNVDNFDFKEADGYAKVGYDFSNNWKGYADFTLMNFRGNDPVYPTLSDPESTAIYRQNIIRGEASATISNIYRNTSGSARVYYSYGNHFIHDPNYFHSTDDRLGVTVCQNFHPWRGGSSTVGFDFDYYSGRIPVSGGKPQSPSNKGTIDHKKILEYSPYITVSQTIMNDLLNLNAGLRIANSDMFDTQLIPQFGFALNPGLNWTVKGNLAMGYRNPSFRELYLYGMANPDLNPEKMMNYEISVAKRLSHWISGEITFYYSKGDNMIQVVDGKNQNTGHFINKGIELSLQSNPTENLRFFATYSFLHGSNKHIVGAPRHQYFIGSEWTPWNFLNIAIDLKGVSDLYVAETVKNQNYALLNMKISWKICRYISVFLRIENITDTHYVINRGYDMPGITAVGGFRVTF